jgi:hypothetical protein
MSRATHPARCANCGGLSTEPESLTLLLIVIHNFAPWVAIYFALIERSWWPVFGYIGAAAVVQVGVFCFVPLVGISEKKVRQARFIRNVGLVVIIGCVILTGFLRR